MKHTHKNTVFLTGATGLVGSYLLKILLKNGHKVYVLARSKDNKKGKERVVEMLNFWDKKTHHKFRKKLVVIEGDITEENLGLKKTDLARLKNETEEIFHCAAAITFNLSLKVLNKINVDGTRNVLNFSVNCLNLKKANHLSTAYVCGDYTGIFTERNLNVGQKFNSNYEQSKFKSEKLAHAYRRKGVWIDIYRPPLIMGESKSGKNLQFKHVFQLIQLCSFDLFQSLPLKNAQINVVPVDQLCNFIYRKSSKSNDRNKTYHAFSKKVISCQQVLTIAARITKATIPKLVDAPSFNFNTLTPIQMMLLKNNFLAINPLARLQGNSAPEFKNFSILPMI